MKDIYLDNSATTKVSFAVAQTVFEALQNVYGNPSSLYTLGARAERELETARGVLSAALGAGKNGPAAGDVAFTSCGSESNNLAILGLCAARKRAGDKIVTTAIEHPSVSKCMDRLEGMGFRVVRLMPDARGNIPVSAFEEAVDQQTVLVSCMHVNNELGSILPVEQIGKMLKRRKLGAAFHVDCVQSFGKLPVKAGPMGADLISVSGHKIHAPKGVAALYVRKGVRLLPQLLGGGQEMGLRSGTQNVPYIMGFAKAVEAFRLEENMRLARTLNERLRRGLADMGGAVVNSGEDALPYLLHFSMPGYRSETLLHYLAQRGVSVSSGSACSRGRKSPVLEACGLPDNIADSALRASFCGDNTTQDVDALLEGLASARGALAKSRR